MGFGPTKSVLIHLNPDVLKDVYKTLYESSLRYILIAEYYSPTPVQMNTEGTKKNYLSATFVVKCWINLMIWLWWITGFRITEIIIFLRMIYLGSCWKKVGARMLRYCTTCVMPNTKPDLRFDEEGVCSACNFYRDRRSIDWTKERSNWKNF